MAIRRAKQTADFTVLPNALINDKRVKWRDLGLLVYLVSKPANWSVSVSQLVKERDAGRDAIRKSLSRLIDAGYVKAEDVRDEHGQYHGIDYIVFDSPQTANSQPEPNLPCPPNPSPERATPTKDRDIQRTDLNKTLGTSVETDDTQGDQGKRKNSRYEYPDDFEQVWAAYPDRDGPNNKRQAFKAWKARRREGVTVEEMLAGVQRYAGHLSTTGRAGTAYVKQAATFFGPDAHYADEYESASAPQGSNIWRDAV